MPPMHLLVWLISLEVLWMASPFYLGMPFDKVHGQMTPLQQTLPHPTAPHRSVRLPRPGSCHHLPHRVSVALVSPTVSGHGHGLPQPLVAPLLVGEAQCPAPAGPEGIQGCACGLILARPRHMCNRSVPFIWETVGIVEALVSSTMGAG